MIDWSKVWLIAVNADKSEREQKENLRLEQTRAEFSIAVKAKDILVRRIGPRITIPQKPGTIHFSRADVDYLYFEESPSAGRVFVKKSGMPMGYEKFGTISANSNGDVFMALSGPLYFGFDRKKVTENGILDEDRICQAFVDLFSKS